MWNPFRRKGAPIQNLDSLDIVGKRRDGGVDLVIVVSQLLDGSDETMSLIRHKVRTYLDVTRNKEFQRDVGNPPRETITIVIKCPFTIDAKAAITIDECRDQAAAEGIRLELRAS